MKLTTAVLLGALAMPALAEPATEPDPELSRSTLVAEEAELRPVVEQQAIDAETSRGMTPDEFKQYIESIEELEQLDWSILVPEPIGQAGDAAAAPKTVRGPFLGVGCEPIDLETAKALGLPRSTGLKVTYSPLNGPAGKAGLRKGDVLTRLNDQLLINAEQFAVLIRSKAVGDTVTLHGLRDGKLIKLDAKLGEADHTPLGPGGKDINREWRVQLNPLQGPIGNPHHPEIQIAPGVWLGDGWGELRQLPANPEQMPEKLRDKIKDLEKQMFQQHQQLEKQMQQQMRQVCLELDLDPDKIRQQADGVTRIQSSMVYFDGKHKITIKHKDRVPQCKIQDKDGNVLFDGPLPANGIIEGLPKNVQLRLNMLLIHPRTEQYLDPPVKEGQEKDLVVLPAPEMTNRQALPKTIAAIEQLEKNHQNIVFDEWHGSDLDLEMLRDRLGIEDAKAGFNRDQLINGLEAIYAKIAGNSEMRSVLAQIEVRNALMNDLGAIGKTFGDNKPARERVNKLIQRINSDLLVQHNDEKHSIRLEGVGLLQRLIIKDRKSGESLYSGFARTSHEFLSGKTDDPGIKEIDRLPQDIKDKVKKMLSDKRVRRLLSDGC